MILEKIDQMTAAKSLGIERCSRSFLGQDDELSYGECQNELCDLDCWIV